MTVLKSSSVHKFHMPPATSNAQRFTVPSAVPATPGTVKYKYLEFHLKSNASPYGVVVCTEVNGVT